MAHKMDCINFQETISDYLEGDVEPRVKAECAAHRLVCRDCRELYNDVRITIAALGENDLDEIGPIEGLEDRIIAATTTGEMLSCNEFDRLLEKYFDGVILAPTFQHFQSHFTKCPQCRRLLAGIEDAISMCKEAKEVEVSVPDTLHERIVAATTGAPASKDSLGLGSSLLKTLWTPRVAAAALIFAAGSLFVISRFGSVTGMAEHVEIKTKRIVSESERRVNDTGERAITGFRNFSSGVQAVLFRTEDSPRRSPEKNKRKAQPAEAAPENERKEIVSPGEQPKDQNNH